MFILKTAIKYILKTDKNRGFTLLEVMISVSIIALIFVSVFRMQAGTIGLAAAGEFNSIAPVLAKQLLTKIEYDPAGWSQAEGDFKDNFQGIKWSCEILDSSLDLSLEELGFVKEKSHNSLKKIKLIITDSSRQRSYKITTWRLIVE